MSHSKNHFLWVLLGLLLALTLYSGNAIAESGTLGSLTWELDENGLLTISGTGNMKPFQYNSSSAWLAFKTNITSVQIQGNVTNISSHAFSDCFYLTNITISDSVTSIDKYAFRNCINLTDITIPNSVTNIGEAAFYRCTSLASITIPDNVTDLSENLFSGCSNLSSIYLPDSITNISDYAFNNCSNLTSIHIPDNITNIGTNAFLNCNVTKYVSLDSSSAKILSKSGYSFRVPGKLYDLCYNYTNSEIIGLTLSNADKDIESAIVLDGVTIIDDGAFQGCTNLTSISIPDSVTSIGKYSFSLCSRLTTIKIPDNVTSIGVFAFSYCANLTNIIMPNGIISISPNTFYECTSLTSIILPATVTSIGSSAFSYCSSLTSIIIPDDVTSIGAYAFSSCTSLTNISIPDNANSIGTYAFSSCTSLTSINIPDSVNSIGAYAFANCNAIIYASLDSNGAKEISKNGFYFRNPGDKYDLRYIYSGDQITGLMLSNVDKDLEMFIIPNMVTSIGDNAFSDCISMTSIIIPDSVTNIGIEAFLNCHSLTSISIPNSLTTICQGAFSGCTSLTSINIPENVTSIGNNAFDACYSLSDAYYSGSQSEWNLISLGINNEPLINALHCICFARGAFDNLSWTIDNEGLLGISGSGEMADYIFSDSSQAWLAYKNAIKSVDIQSGVLSIGNNAFSGCNNLTSIKITDSVTKIKSNAFYNCISLIDVTIPNSVTDVGSNLFYGCINLSSVTLPCEFNTTALSIPTQAQITLNHKQIIEDAAVSPSCHSTGLTTGSHCATCGRTIVKQVIIEATEHTLVIDPAISPTDTKAGLTEGSHCSVCGEVLTKQQIVHPLLWDIEIANNQVAIIHYYGNDLTLTIPSTIDGHTVQSIAEEAFTGDNCPVTIFIPDSMQHINDAAFTIGVTLYANLKSDGAKAISKAGYSFHDLSYKGLELKYLFSNDIITGLEIINVDNDLDEVLIPIEVTSIAPYVFSNCQAIRYATLGSNGAKSLGKAGFTFRDSRYNFDLKYTFKNNAVTGLELTNADKDIVNITIPEDVTSIGYKAFYNCSCLSAIFIPNSVINIGTDAFYGCSNLQRISIPDGVISMGSYVFSSCPAVRYANLNTDGAKTLSKANYSFRTKDDGLEFKYLFDGEKVTGLELDYVDKDLVEVTIPDFVTSIGNSAFARCNRITNIILPNSVVNIGNFAFSECNNLISITLPDYLNSIGIRAFYGCKSLNNISIPNGVTKIEEYTFSGCKKLANITLSDGITEIGAFAFSNCTSLAHISLPDSLISIGNMAFYMCINLSDIRLSNKLTTIITCAFTGCNSLKNITIPSSITELGSCIFNSNDSLTKIVFLADESVSINIQDDFLEDCSATIYCYRYSDIDNYCVTHNIEPVYLDNLNINTIREILLPDDFKIKCGNTTRLLYSIFPDDGSSIMWTSSNPFICRVENGMITALEPGTAVITATVGTISSSVVVQSYKEATGISLNFTEQWLIAHDSLQLNIISFDPYGANAEITWISSNDSLAVVDASGLVTTIKPGDVTITAVTESGISQKCDLHLCYPVSAISLDCPTDDIVIGIPTQIIANITMNSQTCINHLVTFTSSNENIAVVNSENGQVTGVSAGKVKITATAASGVAATCELNVREMNKLILPRHLTTIESEAFANLVQVDCIVIPNSVTSIANDAFSNNSIVIQAAIDSYAYSWALNHGFNVMTP